MIYKCLEVRTKLFLSFITLALARKKLKYLAFNDFVKQLLKTFKQLHYIQHK